MCNQQHLVIRAIGALLMWGFLALPAISQAATVGINKYNDVNGDGSYAGDSRLAGWHVAVYTTGNVLLGSGATTVDNDRVTITDPGISGLVRICESPQDGWHLTRICRGTCGEFEGYTPVADPPADLICGDVDIGTAGDYTVHFLNQQDGIFRAFKYNDVNGNGLQDDGNIPVAGWQMYVDGIVAAVTKEPDGQAQLTSPQILADGTTYRVCEGKREGWQFTYACWGNCGEFEQYTPSVNDDTKVCVDQELNSDTGSDWTIFFGNFQLGSITVQKAMGTPPSEGSTPNATFDFNIANSRGRNEDFQLMIGEKMEKINVLPPDTYTVMEKAPLPDHWMFKEVTCQREGGPERTATDPTVKPPVGPGDSWECTFKNDREPQFEVWKYDEDNNPLKGWTIALLDADDGNAEEGSGKTDVNGYQTLWGGGADTHPRAYRVCEQDRSGWQAIGARWQLVGGGSGWTEVFVSSLDTLEVGGVDLLCVLIENVELNQTYQVEFRNAERPPPVPVMGPIGLGLAAFGLGLIGAWRARRKG